MKGSAAIALGVLVVVCLAPAPAFAETAECRRTTSVSGVDAMVVMLGAVRHVEVGSRAATLTLALDGDRLPITVGYGELTRAAVGGGDGLPGLVPLAVVGACLGQVVRLLGQIRRSARP
ncbi:MAG: hypothetical protein C0418_01800 [Coriobacteriaceae bacterium]|nr:hypothetical protein [Coriobacteriaceae bacterium]